MKAVDIPESGYDVQEFTDLINRELKDATITDVERQYLVQHQREWKIELIQFKKRTEKQFTSSHARSFNLYLQCHEGDTTYSEYLKSLHAEKVWRVHAATFLQKIESRLQTMKNYINDP